MWSEYEVVKECGNLVDSFTDVANSICQIIKDLEPYVKQFDLQDVSELAEFISKADNGAAVAYEVKILLFQYGELVKQREKLMNEINMLGEIRICI